MGELPLSVQCWSTDIIYRVSALVICQIYIERISQLLCGNLAYKSMYISLLNHEATNVVVISNEGVTVSMAL